MASPSPPCNDCLNRRDVPGDAHSACAVAETKDAFVLSMAALRHAPEAQPYIRLDPHGVRNGWAHWPFNFDPIWVDHCAFRRIAAPAA